MNHAGEITPLTRWCARMWRSSPTWCRCTWNSSPPSRKIAEAKAEIFAGLEPGGVADPQPRQSRISTCSQRSAQRARRARRLVRPSRRAPTSAPSRGARGRTARTSPSHWRTAHRLPRGGTGGAHRAEFAGGRRCARCPRRRVETAVPALARDARRAGRGSARDVAVPDGAVLLIDESYNANPASMRAALAALATVPRDALCAPHRGARRHAGTGREGRGAARRAQGSG